MLFPCFMKAGIKTYLMAPMSPLYCWPTVFFSVFTSVVCGSLWPERVSSIVWVSDACLHHQLKGSLMISCRYRNGISWRRESGTAAGRQTYSTRWKYSTRRSGTPSWTLRRRSSVPGTAAARARWAAAAGAPARARASSTSSICGPRRLPSICWLVCIIRPTATIARLCLGIFFLVKSGFVSLTLASSLLLFFLNEYIFL